MDPKWHANAFINCRVQQRNKGDCMLTAYYPCETITKGGISTLSFSCSDSHIAVGTGAGDAYLLSNTNNLVTGPVKMFSEKARITDIRYGSLSQTLIGSCSDNGSFALMDANARKVLKEFPHAHTAPASALAFSPINDLLAVTVGYDKKFITYNANSKSIITSQKTSDPLTSVCFLNCGQSLVLGTMNGNILVYDLRVFSSPKMCFSADSGPILDLQIQPKATSSSGGASVRSTSKSKTASQKEFLQNKGKKREVIRTEKLDLDLAMAGSKTFSPPPQCLSPIKRQTFQQDTTIVKNTPLLKTLAKTSRRTGLSVDEMGILSPLDKENKSPFYRNQPSPSPRRRSSLKPALIVEGLLSPIETSRSNNSSCVTSSPNQSHSEYSIDATIESGAAPKKEGSIISGEVLSLLGGDYGVETKIETISSRAPQDTMVVDLSDCTGDNTPRNNTTSVDVEKNVINREQLNVESVRRNLSLERNVKITVVETPVAPLSSSSVVSIADAQLKSRENVFHSLIRDRFDHSCLQTNGQLHAAPSEMGTISTEGAPTSSVNKSSDETPLKDTSPNFEIAFPAPKSTSDLPTSSESNVSQRNCTESSSSSSDASHLNLQLVKNIVCEALERQQFDINKRFMHLHYTIVKHFFNLRKEMKDLIKETSLREEILTENQRLREEIDRLKCTY